VHSKRYRTAVALAVAAQVMSACAGGIVDDGTATTGGLVIDAAPE
jgi:hypothetical protein